ncbi:hypothetical protein EDB86DRAFT_2902172, partial [Lactarius hatsudake]
MRQSSSFVRLSRVVFSIVVVSLTRSARRRHDTQRALTSNGLKKLLQLVGPDVVLEGDVLDHTCRDDFSHVSRFYGSLTFSR